MIKLPGRMVARWHSNNNKFTKINYKNELWQKQGRATALP
jgi:hypothetical protein